MARAIRPGRSREQTRGRAALGRRSPPRPPRWTARPRAANAPAVEPRASARFGIGERLVAQALWGFPWVAPGADLPALLVAELRRAAMEPEGERAPGSGWKLEPGDLVCVTSKIVARAEGRVVPLDAVEPSAEAERVAAVTSGDPRLTELVLGESVAVSRARPGVLITRHRQGFVSANAGIDRSNVAPPTPGAPAGDAALLVPHDPDQSARRLRDAIFAELGVEVGVLVTDSLGRPFRIGTVGAALGLAGVPALRDQRGEPDLHGRLLQQTVTAFADQVAAVADLVSGQAAEATPVVLIRGLRFPAPEPGNDTAQALCRPAEGDLYA